MPYDDSWKDRYDDWKLASPPEYEDFDEEDPCDHDDEDMDILSGRAFCWRCGSSRTLSDYEIKAQAAHEVAYARMEAKWNRWRWWRDLKDWCQSWLPRRRPVAASDDDIPF